MTTINLDEVARILRDEHHIEATVDQTGGGVATLGAGVCDPDTYRYEAVAGPGWFADPGWTNGRADTADLAVGPDDEGEAEFTYATDDWNEQRVADEVARYVAAARR